MNKKKKILVGLSGGVDSAVSAYLLREEGYEVSCGFMINYLDEDNPNCTTKQDLEIAKSVAEFLDLPLYTFDYRDEYESRIIEYIYREYEKGNTPNPDVFCNNLVKFDLFLEEALSLGYDAIATGHYARNMSYEEYVGSIDTPHLTSPHGGEEIQKYKSHTRVFHQDENKEKDVFYTKPLQREDKNSPPQGGGARGGVFPNFPKDTKQFAKKLRKNQSYPEYLVWENILRKKQLLGYKFLRQHTIEKYIVDFFCNTLGLVIEIDGDFHSDQREKDGKRDIFLSSYGYKILRIPAFEVLQNLSGIYDFLEEYIGNIDTYDQIFSYGSEKDSYYLELPRGENQKVLLRGIDPKKDQSYFLSRLSDFQLSKAFFPIGHLEKSQVREIAKKANLPNANRKDSQGLCFIGKVPMKEFLAKKIPNKEGNIIDTKGRILATHQGVHRYTIGQRKGIEIGGGPALFVVKKDAKTNTITVGTKDEFTLFSKECTILDWRGGAIEDSKKYQAKIRHGQEDQECYLEYLKEDQYHITFENAQRAIAPGQICVIYDDERVMGSGIIT